MSLYEPPPVSTHVPRRCPQCGGTAVIHGRILRAIHDWETTFVECLRLRCCGTTFLSAPRGLTPRARYSDRVVALARTLASLGVPLRECARLLHRARVPATVQAVRRWCTGVERTGARAKAALATVAGGDVAIRLRANAWLVIHTAEPAAALAALRREMGATFAPERQRDATNGHERSTTAALPAETGTMAPPRRQRPVAAATPPPGFFGKRPNLPAGEAL